MMNSNLKSIHEEQWVPFSLDKVFAFFSNAENLEKVTPPWVGFRILTSTPIVMAAGIMIDYEVRIHRLPMRWRSEITEWVPPHHFVDVQRKGPYSEWKHRHSFLELNGGTLVTDDVEYLVPLSWMPGAGLVERFLVRPELNRIFAHRRSALRTHFGLPPE
jgi:ligand-binding SRPBCC domain-containing protein